MAAKSAVTCPEVAHTNDDPTIVEIEDCLSSDDEVIQSCVETFQRTSITSIASGQPIPLPVITAIKSLLFPIRTLMIFTDSWTNKGFKFQDIAEIAYGIVQQKGGPCGILAATQAHIIKHLLDIVPALGTQLRPTASQCKTALIGALTDIIWQCSHSSSVIVL